MWDPGLDHGTEKRHIRGKTGDIQRKSGVSHHLFFKINLFYLFIFSCVGSTCGQRGLLFFAVHRFLIAVTSLVAEPGL